MVQGFEYVGDYCCLATVQVLVQIDRVLSITAVLVASSRVRGVFLNIRFFVKLDVNFGSSYCTSRRGSNRAEAERAPVSADISQT